MLKSREKCLFALGECSAGGPLIGGGARNEFWSPNKPALQANLRGQQKCLPATESSECPSMIELGGRRTLYVWGDILLLLYRLKCDSWALKPCYCGL